MIDRYKHYVLVPLLFANVLFVISCFSVVKSYSIPLIFDQHVSIETPSGAVNFAVSIADTPEKQAWGLMHQESLNQENGMLFIFKESAFHALWMKNTLIPLDAIFIDEDFKIVSIVSKAQPGNLQPFDGGVESRYILEIGAGLAEKKPTCHWTTGFLEEIGHTSLHY